MLEMMKKHLALYADAKWDEYASDLAEDATYEEIATRQLVKGRDNYVELVKRWKRAFPDAKAKVLNGIESGDQAIAEVEWSGTHTGALEGPFGTIAPTNKSGTFRAVIVARTKDGKVIETRHYFDLLTLMSQLGLAPFAGAQPPAEKPAQVPTRH
jgi:steroid delta-isomerase-like uncharacterized protein